MEPSNKKNMALRLELWLSAKQSGASVPSPLRHVVQPTSSTRRATIAAPQESAGKIRRKSFMRLPPTADDDTPTKPLIIASKSRGPSIRKLSGDGTNQQLSPKINQFTVFREEIEDENSKENQPQVHQNLGPALVFPKTSKLLPFEQSKTVPLEQQLSDIALKANQHEQVVLRKAEPESLEPIKPPTSPTLSKVPERNLGVIKNNQGGRLSYENLATPEKFRRSSFCTEKVREVIITDRTREISLQEDLQAMMFLNSVLEQKICELEHAMSQDRLEQSEHGASRGKKHKAELKRLAHERSDYEDRANQMISEMGEQMAMLQSTAMDRIEVLERDLMTERHSSEALMQETIALRAVAAALKKEAKIERRLRAEISDDQPDQVVDKFGRESNSNSEAGYLTDDTARASDDEVEFDDDEEKTRGASLDGFSSVAETSNQMKAALNIDFIPDEKND